MNAENYFTPLRRKLGVATLALACAFTAGLVRSQYVFDVVGIPNQEQLIRVSSSDGELSFGWEIPRPSGITTIRWSSGSTVLLAQNRPAVASNHEVISDWNFAGLHYRKIFRDGDRNSPHEVIRASYWSIVIPLILISVWLFFSKPCGGKPAPVVERQE